MKFTIESHSAMREEQILCSQAGYEFLNDMFDKVKRYEEALKKIVTECNEHDWMWRIAKEALDRE